MKNDDSIQKFLAEKFLLRKLVLVFVLTFIFVLLHKLFGLWESNLWPLLVYACFGFIGNTLFTEVSVKWLVYYLVFAWRWFRFACVLFGRCCGYWFHDNWYYYHDNHLVYFRQKWRLEEVLESIYLLACCWSSFVIR